MCMHSYTHKPCLVILYYSYSYAGVYIFPADKTQELADFKKILMYINCGFFGLH